MDAELPCFRAHSPGGGIFAFQSLHPGEYEGGTTMHSEAYLEARKEFINCLCMSLIGLGVPIYLAFKEWLPVMRAEKKRERQESA